jgi:hypothetical protein
VAALASAVQNGNSPWGGIDKPGLPYNLPPGRGPKYTSVVKRPTTTLRAGQTPISGPCGKAPDTGVTRTYDFSVSYQTIAPDGVKKNGLVVNGGFPGPLIEANWGDWVKGSLSYCVNWRYFANLLNVIQSKLPTTSPMKGQLYTGMACSNRRLPGLTVFLLYLSVPLLQERP